MWMEFLVIDHVFSCFKIFFNIFLLCHDGLMERERIESSFVEIDLKNENRFYHSNVLGFVTYRVYFLLIYFLRRTRL